MDLYEEFGVGIPVQAPNAVAIAANAISSSEIDISVAWSGGSLTGIPLYYSTNAGGPWALLTTFSSAPASFRHLSLAPSTPYFYQTYALAGGAVGPATYATATTQASSGGLTITSLSPPAGSVGSFYSYALTASGGSGNYLWNIESAYPNYGKWLALPVATLQGVPQNAETSTVVVRCTDANSPVVTTTATLLVSSTASGALATSAQLQFLGGVVNGAYANPMLLQGGKPPYSFTSTVAQPYTMSVDGWLLGAPTASGSVSPSVTATDSSNATLTFFPSFTVASAQLGVLGYDPTLGTINLPPAIAGSAYSHTLTAYNASGAVTWSITSGSLPTGLTLSGSVISGTPANPGNRSFTLKGVDTASKSFSAPGYLNVSASQIVNRPAYNTGTGFFVLNGKLYDPNGYLFTVRGVNRNHYDSSTWASGVNGAISGTNTSRFFLYKTDGTVPVSNYVAVANTQCIANNILPIITMSLFPDGTSTSGNTSTTELTNGVNWWVANVASFAPYMKNIAINIANEWGASPTFGGSYTTWVSAYSSAISSLRTAGYTCPIVIDALDQGEDIGGFTGGYAAQILAADPQQNVLFDFHFYNTTNAIFPVSAINQAGNAVVTFNNTSATNPFIALTNFSGAVYLQNVSGMTQINGGPYTVAAHGGASGAWTMTLNVNSSSFNAYTGGGQIVDSWYFDERIAAVQGFIALGLACIVGEFGPAGLNNSTCSPSQIIASCEARGVGWAQWAWDDNNLGGGATSFSGWFGMTLAGPGTYTAPASLTAPGLNTLINPRLGLDALGAPASAFLTTTNQINWNPGFYLLTFNQALDPTSATYSGSVYATDMANAAATGPNIKGYAFFANWAWFSNAQGVYTNILNNGTSFFASLMADAVAKNQKIIVQFNPGDFSHGANVPTSSRYIPNYILTGSTYGAANQGNTGLTASSPYLYGYYQTGNGGPMANWVGNSNVYNAMLADIQQFAALWDGNANLEAFVMCADDVMYPNSGTGLTGNSYYTTLTSLMLAIKGYFKYTNVALQMAGAQSTAGQSYVQTLVQAGVLVSRSDIEGFQSWDNTAVAITFTGTPSGTSATIASGMNPNVWPGNTYSCKITSTGQVVAMTVPSNGVVTFSPAVTGATTNAATVNRAWPRMGPAMQAWANLQSPGSTWSPPTPTLQSYSSSIMFAEEGDFTDVTGTSPVGLLSTGAQMAKACNDQVTGGVGWHASHMLISYSNSTTWANRTTNASNGAFNFPLTNTAYPSVYPNSLTALWPDPLPSGVVGVPYSYTLRASGGSGSYTFSVSSGTLPTGLTLNSATGVISGTPTATATMDAVSFTVTG